jgi:hypothetical protein
VRRPGGSRPSPARPAAGGNTRPAQTRLLLETRVGQFSVGPRSRVRPQSILSQQTCRADGPRLRQTAVGVGVGGNPNPYMYPSDPINGSDLTGDCGRWGDPFHECGDRYQQVGRAFAVNCPSCGFSSTVLRKGSSNVFGQGDFGQRHIQDDHEFDGLSRSEIQSVLAHPSSVRYNSRNQTWSFSRTIKEKCWCGSTHSYTGVVVVSRSSFPTDGGYGTGIITAYKNGYHFW